MTRIFELTGVTEYLSRKRFGPLHRVVSWLRKNTVVMARRDVGGRLYLKLKFAIDHFRGKRCLDLGCGPGRWTRTLPALGASVKSTDVSRHALLSTSRFNKDVEEPDLFDILPSWPDLHEGWLRSTDTSPTTVPTTYWDASDDQENSVQIAKSRPGP